MSIYSTNYCTKVRALQEPPFQPLSTVRDVNALPFQPGGRMVRPSKVQQAHTADTRFPSSRRICEKEPHEVRPQRKNPSGIYNTGSNGRPFVLPTAVDCSRIRQLFERGRALNLPEIRYPLTTMEMHTHCFPSCFPVYEPPDIHEQEGAAAGAPDSPLPRGIAERREWCTGVLAISRQQSLTIRIPGCTSNTRKNGQPWKCEQY